MKKVQQRNSSVVVKFGLSEKHKKFEKNLPHGLDVYYVSKCTKHKKDCANSCVLNQGEGDGNKSRLSSEIYFITRLLILALLITVSTSQLTMSC